MGVKMRLKKNENKIKGGEMRQFGKSSGCFALNNVQNSDVKFGYRNPNRADPLPA